jgi:micrococcal nuclease
VECYAVSQTYTYRATISRVVDGDTVIASLSLGLDVYHTVSLRLLGVDTPELFHGTDRDAGAAAKEATALWVRRVVADAAAIGEDWPFLVTTHKDKESFGRYLATVWSWDMSQNLTIYLRSLGYPDYVRGV